MKKALNKIKLKSPEILGNISEKKKRFKNEMLLFKIFETLKNSSLIEDNLYQFFDEVDPYNSKVTLKQVFKHATTCLRCAPPCFGIDPLLHAATYLQYLF